MPALRPVKNLKMIALAVGLDRNTHLARRRGVFADFQFRQAQVEAQSQMFWDSRAFDLWLHT